MFLFLKAGGPQEKYDQPIKKLYIRKWCRIVGEFRCAGEPASWDSPRQTRGILMDLERVRAFAKGGFIRLPI